MILQSLISEGKLLQNGIQLKDYAIERNSTIILNIRLREGVPRINNPNGPTTFKDVVKKKTETHTSFDSIQNIPRPYIIEQIEQAPVMEVNLPQVVVLQSRVAICRFNGFWPRSEELHQWVFATWTQIVISTYAPRVFFVVQFDTQKDLEFVLNEGPWFWGRVGLFITPSFPEFDATTMKVSTIPIWVRLHNLSLPFWHHQILEGIGNKLGNFKKMDLERKEKGIFTFARICVEIDLSKGLPDRIHLVHKNFQ